MAGGPIHKNYTTDDLHVPGYHQAGDPGAVGAGIDWLDTTASPPTLKRRNPTNAGWDVPLGGGAAPGTITNAMLADMANKTYKGRHTAGTGVPEDVTVTNLTADLNAMVGDSGSGGTKGLVPAPAAGDAAAGKLLKADATWQEDIRNIEFVIDGGGATITTGVKGYITVDYAATILQATLLADQSGSIVVNIWKCTYAQFDAGSTHPVAGDKITASAPPTITTATKSQDSTLTGWTVAISAGDILAFNVDSITTCQRVTLSLKVKRTG